MEENKNVDIPVNEAEVTAKQNTAVKTETITQTTKIEDRVFTQAQLDEIVVTRLSKERARVFKKLGIEDENQIDIILKRSTEYDSISKEVQTLKKEKTLSEKKQILNSLNADPEFTDYLLQTIGDVESIEEYSTKAKEYLGSHPKFVKEQFSNINSSVNINKGGVYPDFTQMTPEQYLAWREKNKL
jgi:hypothetical protein